MGEYIAMSAGLFFNLIFEIIGVTYALFILICTLVLIEDKDTKWSTWAELKQSISPEDGYGNPPWLLLWVSLLPAFFFTAIFTYRRQ